MVQMTSSRADAAEMTLRGPDAFPGLLHRGKNGTYPVTPDEVLATITTPAELVDALDRAGVNEFASLVRSHLT